MLHVDPDSRVRTHLANERTFLAWLRTGLSLMALGMAAAQFLHGESPSSAMLTDWIAFVLVSGGILVALTGAVQYRRERQAIEAGVARSSTGAIIFGTALVVLVGVLSIGFVVFPR